MLFPLFWKIFTNILKIYELPKIYNKILKKLFKIIIYQINSVSQIHLASDLYGKCTLGGKNLFGTKLKKILGRIFFKRNLVPKEPFFLVASDGVPILCNKPCIKTGAGADIGYVKSVK